MSKVMDLNNLGKFRLDRILVQYDSPFIFTCVNEKNKMLLFVEEDYDDTKEVWISIFIDEQGLYELLSKNKSIQETFINTDVHQYFRIEHIFSSDSYVLTKKDSLPQGILNSGRDYINISTEQEEKELIQGLIKTYNETQMPAMDLHFNKYTRSHSLPVEFIINVLQDFKKIFNGIVRVKSKSLEVEPCPGSLVLRFKAVNPDKTIDKNTSSYAFKAIGDILSSNDPENVKSILIENPRIIAPLKSFYSTLAKSNRDFEIAAITDEERPLKYKTIFNSNVNKFYSGLKDKKLSESHPFESKGVLEGFCNIKSTFSFISENGDVIKGKISKDINDKKPKIQDVFVASMTETVEIDLENAKEKKTYVLNNLEHID